MYDSFKKIDSLALEKSELCMLGTFARAFLERAPVITEELFPNIESSFDCHNFQSMVMGIYTKKYENERLRVIQEMEERASHPNAAEFYTPLLDMANRKLEIKTFPKLLDSIEFELNEFPGIMEIYENSYRHIHNGESGETYILDNYKHYYIGSLLYENYKILIGKQNVLDHKYSSLVHYEYKNIGIDLFDIDAQFSKYKLLSINDNIQIINDKDSQTICDNRIGKYFWISIPRKLLFSIEDLIDKKFIKDISFRVDYVSESIPIMEEMEFGSPLKIKIESLPELSKFYSKDNYEDKLWVRHDKDKKSITFEEHLEDFEVIEENIITQVVHLEYFSNGDGYFISHLDHEFIVYTLEQYQERLCQPDVKGYKKVKTFKIDNSKIPFYYKNNDEYFLYQVLGSYLKDTDLITEYFEEINV